MGMVLGRKDEEKYGQLVEYDSGEESDSSSSDGEEDSEIVKTSILTQLSTKFGPTVEWGWSKLGTFGWFASTTFLVMLMPLIFEVEREAMMKEMMQQQQAQAQQQQAQAQSGGQLSNVKLPAPGSLPSV